MKMIMGARKTSERLSEIRPVVLPSTMKFSRLSLTKLYVKSRNMGIAAWNDGLEYAEFIHALWNTLLKNDEFKNEAVKIEEAIGHGDAIQLLSDIVLEDRRSQLT